MPQHKKLTSSTTVLFVSVGHWPEDYPDMTLEEAMAFEADAELWDVVDYNDEAVRGKTVVVVNDES